MTHLYTTHNVRCECIGHKENLIMFLPYGARRFSETPFGRFSYDRPFHIEDAPSIRSNPFISAPLRGGGILNENGCKS